MDSINNNMRIGNLPPMKTGYKVPSKVEVSDLPKDNITLSSRTEMPAKPVAKGMPTIETRDLAILGKYNPVVSASIDAGTPGSPIFKGIAGTIAKWLISTEEEQKLGEMISGQVESEMSVSNDPQMNARVKNLGQKLAAHSSRKDINYEFKVIDDDTVNAFACPGGHIYVHKGLLDRFPDDSHLAFILGHEIGHVEHRDSIDKLGTNYALMIIQAALGKVPGKLDDLLGAVVGQLYDSRLSQKAEYKADRAGAVFMEKIGVDAKHGSEALLGLESAGQKEPGVLERLLSSHPPTKERAKRVAEYANSH